MAPRLTRLLVTAALLAAASSASAAPALRKQLLVNGDFTIVGNTLAFDCNTIPDAGVAPVVGTAPDLSGKPSDDNAVCGNNWNDTGTDVFWLAAPSGATGGTAATGLAGTSAETAITSAMLALPANAVVRYARVYWGAQWSTTEQAYDTAATLVTPDGASHALAADAAASRAIAAPGQGYWYQSSAEITAVLQAVASARGTASGRYSMTGVYSRPLWAAPSSDTTFDAWWMVLFYEDPADPSLRQLTLFDGLDYVRPGFPADVTLGGFLVPNGGFDAKLAVVTYEGDYTFDGDSLYFQGYKSTAPEPAFLTTLADAENPGTNFFNGTRSWLGAPRSVTGDLPQMSGTAASMMSFDLDVVDLKAIGAIHAGDDTAKIRATTSLDVFALGAFVTSINTLKPSFIQTVKTAANLTRADGVFAGDVIEYTIDTQNTGNDPSIQTVMQDLLPVGVTYVPGSLQIAQGANQGAKTDAAGDDQAEYVTSTRAIYVRLGLGADAFVGGTMAIGATARVKFRATVNAGAAGVIQNRAEVIAAGLSGEPARTFDSNPPTGTGPTDLPVDQCLGNANCGGATPACWTTPTPNVCVGCTDASYCSGATPICDLSAHACVGLTTLAPAAQDRTTIAGTFSPFPLTLTSNLAGPEVYDLDVTDGGCGWGVELWTSGGALLATRNAGGVWTIAPGGDTDGGGKPDLGATAGGGGTSSFVLRLVPPGPTPMGAACAATVSATGRSSGLVATAAATLRVSGQVTWTPSYTGTSAKVASRGGDVGFPGVVQNNTAAPLTFSLAANVGVSPVQGTPQVATFWSDPNGDGDPSDGVEISSVGPVPEYGGQVHVVLVLHAANTTGTAFTTGTILDASATATAPGPIVATQAVQAKVQYAATYSDPARTLAASRFAPCDTVYLGASLLPAGFPFALEWYPKASPVRGTDTPYRTVEPWSVSGGAGADQLQVPANALGTWTVLVVQKTTPTATVLDSLTIQVERAGAFTALGVPARIAMADGLSVTAAVQNQNAGAAFAASQLAYTVTGGALYMDGTGAFSAIPGLAHLTAPLSVTAGATAADGWSGAAAWPAPGTYQVQAEWQLQCGGVTQVIAPATASFEVAPAAPAITSPAAGALVGPTTAFSGTALPGASVTVTVGATPCGPVVADGGGTWSCTPGTALGDGSWSATAVQTVSGASSDPSAAVGFTVDGTPPAVGIGVPAPDALLGAAGAPGGAVAFSGTAEAGATVVVSVGATSATASRSGAAWSATLTLADGPRTATATATDAAGNSASAQVTFTLDTTPPAAPVVSAPSAGASFSATTAPGGFVSVQGTAEAGATVDVTIGATTQAASRAGSAFAAAFTLSDGPHAVSAVATDAAGNVSAPGTTSFTLDATPPAPPSFAFPLDGALLGGGVAPGGLLTLTGGTESGTSVAVTVDGVPHAGVVSGTGWSLALTLGDGLHPASAVATDGAGNVSVPAAIAFRVDATAPAAPVLAAVPSPTNDEPIAIGGTADVGSTVELFLDGVSQGTAIAGPAFSFSLASVSAGSRTAVAVARDAAGNVSPGSVPVTFLVDRTAPGLATVDVPASGAVLGNAEAPAGAVTFSGTSELGSTVEVEVDGNLVELAPAPGGAWTAVHALLDGLHQVRVRATDAAGNAGAWSASVAFTLDVEAPLAPVLDAPASPTSAASVTVTGVAEAGASVGILVDGAFAGTAVADGSGAFSLDVALAEGTRVVIAVAVDAGGNGSVSSNAVTVRVDRTAPAAPVLGALVVPAGATTVVVSGTAEPGAIVAVLLDGAYAGTTEADGGGQFSMDVAVDPGSHTVTGTATDGAGNESSASGPVTFDVVLAAPIVASTATGHVVGGGCGCGAGGGTPASALLLLGLALAVAPRRRWRAGARGAAALLVAASAASVRADQASFAVDRFQLDPGAYGMLGVAGARVPETFDLNLSLGVEGASGLLRLEREGSTTDLVGNAFAAQVGGAVALGGKHELGLVLPVALARSTEAGGRMPAASVTGIGDLKLVPKVVLPGAGGFRFAASLPVTLPTAKKDALLGEGTFTVNPTGIAETSLGGVRLAGNLGVAVRPTRTYYDLEVGSAITWGAAAEVPFRAGGLAWTALAAAWGEVGLADSGTQVTPAELDAAVRWQRSGIALTAGLGTGIVNGYGTPGLRAFALAAWRPPAPARAEPPRATPVVKVEPPPPPDPCDPGQAHAPEQCPALDDDGDAIANAADRCPLVAGVAEEAGCPAKPPPPVVVVVKEEPPPPPPPPPPGPCDPGQAHAPEQCPALDDDGDGFANAQDRCPLVAGIAQHQGCPPPKAVLSIEKKKIEIKEAVFFENGKDRIEKRSHQLLEDIARILEDHPEVKLVSIEGHTDSTGTPERNQQLSERRASAVKIFLVTKGASPDRLQTRGFGQTRPVAKNDTRDGKAKNRRVEFLVK